MLSIMVVIFLFLSRQDLEAGDNVVEATEYLSEEGKNVQELFQSYQQQYAVLVQLEKLD